MRRLLIAMCAALLVAGCKKPVDQEHMDAIADWSKRVCKCKDADDPEKCAKKVYAKKPDYGPGIPFDTYTRESLQAFDQIEYVGTGCYAEIGKAK